MSQENVEIVREIFEAWNRRDFEVVVRAHGRSAAASMALGSVSHWVVNHCQRPVLVAPRSGDHEAVTA